MEKNRSIIEVSVWPVRKFLMFSSSRTRDRVAHPPRLEIRQRQRQQMPEQARAKLDIDAAGGVRKHIITQAGEKTSKSEHTSKAMHTTLRVL